MSDEVPAATIRTFAKTIHSEARKYGFSQVDTIRLINEMMDLATDAEPPKKDSGEQQRQPGTDFNVQAFPLQSERLRIRLADAEEDLPLLRRWMDDNYGKHFMLSCATAQRTNPSSLLENPDNAVGIVSDLNGGAIGAIAYLDIDARQKRAELRKLIGVPEARGQGYAEEATRLWLDYGARTLGLEKVYVSTLQTHLRNIQLNESIGFRVEGLLRGEVSIDGERHDVLRMGLLFE